MILSEIAVQVIFGMPWWPESIRQVGPLEVTAAYVTVRNLEFSPSPVGTQESPETWQPALHGI
jgi:hypothetical protein